MNKTKYPMLYSSGPQVAWERNQNKHVRKTDPMNTPMVTMTLRFQTSLSADIPMRT